jgi:copper chaperone
MTCGHRVAAVSGELSKLNRVKDVSVDLDRGQVTVTGDADLDREAVRQAVETPPAALARDAPSESTRYRCIVAYTQTCPRCGADFVGDDKERVADAVVDHGASAHNHRLDRDIVLAHLQGVHPYGRDVD